MELLSSGRKLAFTPRVGGDRDTSKQLKNYPSYDNDSHVSRMSIGMKLEP